MISKEAIGFAIQAALGLVQEEAGGRHHGPRDRDRCIMPPENPEPSDCPILDFETVRARHLLASARF